MIIAICFNYFKNSKGVFTRVISDGMTRGPVLRYTTAMNAADVKMWIENEENFALLKKAFDSTSR